jgi:hypothetical protein
MCIAVLAGCRTVPVNREAPASGSSSTGAVSSRAALDTFFAAIKSGDLQAASVVWGSRDGAARDLMTRDQVETRLIIMQCYLVHESLRLVGQPRTKTDSVFYKVELTNRGRAQETDVVTVNGPASRWYVADSRIDRIAPGCG